MSKIRKFPLRFTIQQLSGFSFLPPHFPVSYLTYIRSPAFSCQDALNTFKKGERWPLKPKTPNLINIVPPVH